MQVDFYREFQKDLKKLSKKEQLQFGERIALFLEDPMHPLLHNHALIGKLRGLRSINITGDIRALYEEITPELAFFVAIGTHSELYE